RRIHPQWSENARRQKFAIGLSTRIFDDQAEQIITGVRVGPLLARTEVQGTVNDQSDEFFWSVVFAHGCEKIRQLRITLDAGGVREQVAHSHIAPGERRVRVMPVDGI